ncbi:hypothetical protein HKX48_006245 [Thoreauomyces humboldtii]|nr:hypothetical protein HKX48_006245 [Thoreauomyces humboldtii]
MSSSILANPTTPVSWSVTAAFSDRVGNYILRTLPSQYLIKLHLTHLSPHELFLISVIVSAFAFLVVVSFAKYLLAPDRVRLLHAPSSVPIRRAAYSKGKKDATESVSLLALLRERVPSLADPRGRLNAFRPTLWLFNGHLQTIYAAVFAERGTRHITYDRELIYFPDGGNIALDWHAPSRDDDPAPDRVTADDATPIVVISHGLTGGSHETYVRELVHECATLGYRSVVVNFRGCAETQLTSSQLYCGWWTKDLKAAVGVVKKKHPRAPLFAVGFSLGANILTKFVGECGEDCPFLGAVSVSNPFDLLGGSRALHRTWLGRNLYSRSMTQNLIRVYRRHSHSLLKVPLVDPASLVNVRYIYEFDEAFTRVVFGFRTVHEYYRMASSAQYLPEVKVPMLLITADDDPIVDPELHPTFETTSNPNLILATTRYGGHIGWYSGLIQPKRWIQKPIGEFINAIFEVRTAQDKGQ